MATWRPSTWKTLQHCWKKMCIWRCLWIWDPKHIKDKMSAFNKIGSTEIGDRQKILIATMKELELDRQCDCLPPWTTKWEKGRKRKDTRTVTSCEAYGFGVVGFLWGSSSRRSVMNACNGSRTERNRPWPCNKGHGKLVKTSVIILVYNS